MQIQTGAASFVPDGLLEPSGLGCLVIVARHHGLHLTVSQLIHDNMLPDPEASDTDLIKSAGGAGLKAKAVHLTWNGLNQLKNALPAIVRLKHGGCMVLLRLEGIGGTVRLLLQDPNAGDDALLLIDQVRFEKVWTGEVVLVKRNYVSNTIESPFSVPSDLRPAGQNTSDGVPTSLANVHLESHIRGDRSHFGLTPALDEARVNLGSSEPLVTRSASPLTEETSKELAQAMVESPPGQIRARIGEARTTANTGSTGSAPSTSVATAVAGQEHALSQTPTNPNPSNASTRQFIVLTVGVGTTVIVWASVLATQTPILPLIANLVQTDSPRILNVDRREANKTSDRLEVDSDVEPKSRNTNVSSTNGNATHSLDGQSEQRRSSTEMPPAIELKSLQTPADSVNRTETKLNSKTMSDVQQLSNADRISRPEYQLPIHREISKMHDRMEVDSDIGPKSKNTNLLSTNGSDTTRSLDKQSNQRRAPTEKMPAIEAKSRLTPLDSVNRSEARFNLRTTADVQQVQQRLVELGYLPFLPDGVWGPHSIQALRAFRITAGLGSGDQWDRKTEAVLFATTAPKAAAPTASPL